MIADPNPAYRTTAAMWKGAGTQDILRPNSWSEINETCRITTRKTLSEGNPMRLTEIVFDVTEVDEGGYDARAASPSRGKSGKT